VASTLHYSREAKRLKSSRSAGPGTFKILGRVQHDVKFVYEFLYEACTFCTGDVGGGIVLGTASERGLRAVRIFMAPMPVVNSEALHELAALLAAGLVTCSGFERMVPEVYLGKVGALPARDASRFAQNGREWQQLVEVCVCRHHAGSMAASTNTDAMCCARLNDKLRWPHGQNWSTKIFCNFGSRVARLFDARVDRRSQEA
jgi:hypothetical protein